MRRFFLVFGVFIVLFSSLRAQAGHRQISVSVLDFGDTSLGKFAAEQFRIDFRTKREFLVLDSELTRAAARGIGYSGSLNMSLEEARDLGAAMATEFYLIGDAQTLRRSSSQSPIYYESYCSVFVVSARTGRLVFWDRPSFKNKNERAAVEELSVYLAGHDTTQQCLRAIQQAEENESSQRAIVVGISEPLIEEAPDDEKKAAGQGLRLPRPYRRLRPEYPESAARAEAEATVDVVVDVGSDGEVGQIQIARWAGFGLDEATVATVRQMHFFPAMRNGVPIPMRVLLRYNFRKSSK